MDKSYKKVIIVILCILSVVCGLGLSYRSYRKNHSESAIIVKLNNLSINFLNGNVIKFDSKEKEISFSVINDSTDDIYYSIKIDNIRKLGKDVKLTLNDKTTIDLKKDDEILLVKV